MRAQEFQTPTASGTDILRYVRQQHHDFQNDQDVLEYPRWRLEQTPLENLITDDPDRDDPLGRVLDIDYDQVERIKQRGPQDIRRRPIVADPAGAIIDGNHRAVAAREMGLTSIPAWRPVEDFNEGTDQIPEEMCWSDLDPRMSVEDRMCIFEEYYTRKFQNPGLTEQPQRALHFLRPGELRGSYTDQDLIRMGFRRASNGAWYMDQARWERLVATGQLREDQSQSSNLVTTILRTLPATQEIWLHGSRARGTHRADSDTDILVVVPDNLVGDKYLDAVRKLQKLNSHFDNYDIQPTKAGYNIHRIAQEEGKLLWSRPKQDLLQERVSSRLYHYTNLHAGTQALETGRFELSSTLGTDWEEKFAPPGYPYFLSATRTLTGGYHDYVGSSAVMFVLAGSWFNARYPGRAVDYWGNRDPLKMHHRRHEAEDRIFSRKSTIPLGGVESVHVLVKPDAEPTHRARARRLLIAAKRRSIPAYLYSDEQAWRRLDTGNTAAVSTLQGADTSGRAWARGHRGYLMPWMELIFGRDQTRLSKRADQLRYNLKYNRDTRDAVRGLGTDLSNARKPNSGPDREHAVKIIDLMRRERLQTLADLVNWIRDRWAAKPAGVDENFADGRKPGRKGLSRRVGIPKKATLAQLEKIARSSTGERRRMAQWQLNMRRGQAKKNK